MLPSGVVRIHPSGAEWKSSPYRLRSASAALYAASSSLFSSSKRLIAACRSSPGPESPSRRCEYDEVLRFFPLSPCQSRKLTGRHLQNRYASVTGRCVPVREPCMYFNIDNQVLPDPGVAAAQGSAIPEPARARVVPGPTAGSDPYHRAMKEGAERFTVQGVRSAGYQHFGMDKHCAWADPPA
jgi:hypothetical protein